MCHIKRTNNIAAHLNMVINLFHTNNPSKAASAARQLLRPRHKFIRILINCFYHKTIGRKLWLELRWDTNCSRYCMTRKRGGVEYVLYFVSFDMGYYTSNGVWRGTLCVYWTALGHCIIHKCPGTIHAYSCPKLSILNACALPSL